MTRGMAMNRRRAGLTRTELCVILGSFSVFVVILGFVLPLFARSRETGRRAACMQNLQTIGKALAAYRNDNNGYFPFSWGPGGSAPEAFNNAAASSLGLLYPKYLTDAKVFRCPSTENETAFTPDGEGANCTWTLTGSSYGYDPRVLRQAGEGVVIMADMDGVFSYSRDSGMQNHANNGANVLYADGHVKWVDSFESNFTSDNPKDNIFAPDPWDADTDAYLVNEDLNDLTISFDGYEHLKQPVTSIQ